MSVSIVQSAWATSGATHPNSTSVTLTGVAAGNALVAFIGFLPPSGTNGISAPTPTDTNGTWSSAVVDNASANGGANALGSAAFLLANVASGTHTVTWDFSAAQAYVFCGLVEVAGSNGVVDVSAGSNSASGAVTTMAESTGTLASTGEGVLAFLAAYTASHSGNMAISDPPSGFTSLTVQNDSAASTVCGEASYVIPGVTTSQTATWTWTGSGPGSAIILALQVAAPSAATSWLDVTTGFHPGKAPGRQSARFYQSPKAATSDLTVTLTGQGGTFTPGTLAPSTTVPLLGQAATFTPGTLVPSTTVPLLGQAGTFSAGTVTPGISISLSGSLAQFSSGLLSASGGDVFSSLGFISFPGNPALSSPINPLQFPKLFSSSQDTIALLTGQAAVFVAGTLAPSTTVPLLGQGAVFTPGAVTPGMSMSLSGSLASFSTGLMTPSTTVALTGQPGAFTPGQISPGISMALSGNAATFSAGSMTPSTSIGLAGQRATFTPGTLTPSGGTPVIGPQVTIVYFIGNMGTLMGRQ